MEEYHGEVKCRNYGGIIDIKRKTCCGGKLVVKCRIACKVHKNAYADDACRRETCGYYEPMRETEDECGPSVSGEKLS